MKYYSDKVRRVKEGFILKLQVLKDDQWVDYWSTDEMSNDNAYSEIAALAERISSKFFKF